MFHNDRFESNLFRFESMLNLKHSVSKIVIKIRIHFGRFESIFWKIIMFINRFESFIGRFESFFWVHQQIRIHLGRFEFVSLSSWKIICLSFFFFGQVLCLYEYYSDLTFIPKNIVLIDHIFKTRLRCINLFCAL